jgi:hypothetical protein
VILTTVKVISEKAQPEAETGNDHGTSLATQKKMTGGHPI